MASVDHNKSIGPYFDSTGKPVLRDSVIVVADILGYSREIKLASQLGQSSPFLNFVYSALKDSFRNVDDPSGKKWIAKMMTDNLVIAYPVLGKGVGSFEFSQACYEIGHFQREMMKYGLPIRGGISVGNIHVSDLLVLPSENILAEMVEAEAIASMPRIVLLDSSKKFLSLHREIFEEEEISHLLWEDSDSAQFVNYLRPLSRPFLKEGRDLLLAHKQFIEGRLKEFSQRQRIYFKYVWTANYHNKFCSSEPEFSTPEFLIESRST